MKDIVDVNIAGIAFKLDAEAFALLDGYLYKIRERYGSSPDGNEILEDIEARIAELILSQQDAGTVVRKPLVESAIHQLGAPEEFAEMAPEEERADEASVPPPYRPEKLARRLYRNPEGRKLGGICSGLGAYFNADVTLIRLLFLLPFFLMTFFYAIGWHDSGKAMNALFVAGLFLYILLWIVIPKARTPRQKLEMKGEKITTSRIEQTFREEFARTAPNTDARTQVRHERNASVFAELVSVLGKILLFLVKALVAFFALILSVAIIAVLVAIVSAIAGSVWFLSPDLHFPYPGWTLTVGGLIVLLPLLLLLYGFLKVLFGFRSSKAFLSSVTVIWIIALVFGTVIWIKNVQQGNFAREKWFPQTEHREHDPKPSEPKTELLSVPFELSGPVLYVEPLDSLAADTALRKIPIKLRTGKSSYKKPTVVIRGKDTVDRPDFLVRNDTLFVNPTVGDRERHETEFNVYLPKGTETRVNPLLDYNEYLEKK